MGRTIEPWVIVAVAAVLVWYGADTARAAELTKSNQEEAGQRYVRHAVEVAVPYSLPAMAPRSSIRPLKLIKAEFGTAEVSFVPADIESLETFLSDPLISFSIPGELNRTALFTCVSGPHGWRQVVSSVPLNMHGLYALTFSSSVLPPPGNFTLAFNMEWVREFDASTVQRMQIFDPAPCAAVEETLLIVVFKNNFTLTDEQAQVLARAFLESPSTVEFGVQVTMQSVGFFNLSSPTFSIWGD